MLEQRLQTFLLSLMTAGLVGMGAITWDSSVSLSAISATTASQADLISALRLDVAKLNGDVVALGRDRYYAADARADFEKMGESIRALELRVISMERERE